MTTMEYLNTSLSPASLNTLTSLPVLEDIFSDSMDIINSSILTLNETFANLTLSNSSSVNSTEINEEEEEEEMCPIPEEELDMCHLQVKETRIDGEMIPFY